MKKGAMCLYGIGSRDFQNILFIKGRVSAFIIDETIIQISSQHFWLWLCIESIHRSVLVIYIFEERNMFIVQKFMIVIWKYGKHTVYTDGGTWYDQA